MVRIGGRLIGETPRDLLLEVKEVPQGAAANGAFGGRVSGRGCEEKGGHGDG